MQNKYKFFLVILFLGFAMIGYWSFLSEERRVAGFETSTIKTIRDLYFSIQESYMTEYKEYITAKEELRKGAIPIEHVKLFFHSDEVPQDLQNKLGSENVPFLERQKYSILILLEKKDIGYSSIWKLTQDGKVTKVFPKK